MVWYWIVYPLGAGSNPVSLVFLRGSNSVGRVCALHAQSRRFESDLLQRLLWDEAVVACQFHALNVEGSNPSPTKSSSGGMVDTVDLKSTPFTGVSVQIRGWVAGMVELADTLDLGSNG